MATVVVLAYLHGPPLPLAIWIASTVCARHAFPRTSETRLRILPSLWKRVGTRAEQQALAPRV